MTPCTRVIDFLEGEKVVGDNASIDSANYKHTFYGILNAQGEFWTPLAFHSEQKAEEHIAGFWHANEQERALFRSKCSIVPVRIQLTTLPTPKETI